MITTIESRDLTASTTFNLPANGQFDASVVLRAFDELRKEIAQQAAGQDGVAVGYDVLDINWGRIRVIEPKSRITVTATQLSSRPGRHQVDYVARVGTSAANDAPGPAATIMRARGWTVCPGELANNVSTSQGT